MLGFFITWVVGIKLLQSRHHTNWAVILSPSFLSSKKFLCIRIKLTYIFYLLFIVLFVWPMWTVSPHPADVNPSNCIVVNVFPPGCHSLAINIYTWLTALHKRVCRFLAICAGFSACSPQSHPFLISFALIPTAGGWLSRRLPLSAFCRLLPYGAKLIQFRKAPRR